jgi:rRNA maturation endonuclease Nob1
MSDPHQCQWAADCDGNFDTQCGQCFTFIDGGPEDNKARFCCFCGGKIRVKPYKEEEQ